MSVARSTTGRIRIESRTIPGETMPLAMPRVITAMTSAYNVNTGSNTKLSIAVTVVSI